MQLPNAYRITLLVINTKHFVSTVSRRKVCLFYMSSVSQLQITLLFSFFTFFAAVGGNITFFFGPFHFEEVTT